LRAAHRALDVNVTSSRAREPAHPRCEGGQPEVRWASPLPVEDVRPRHPRGGPDGGRDIQAVFRQAQLAYAAVGFVNQANDSNEHKKRINAKFSEDLASALGADLKPEVFVFFTNLNFTSGEKDALIAEARKAGITYCDIFDRERIRISLEGTSKNRRFPPPRKSDSRFSYSERGRLAWDSLASSI